MAAALLAGLSACGAEQSVPQPDSPTVWDGTAVPNARQNSDGRDAETGESTYRQMLENRYVHDSDGILTDGENSRS